MNKKFSSEQHGRSMVEMLGVLAIIGVLSVGGIAGYSKAMTKFKVSKSMDQISMLVANIRTLYSGQVDYRDLDSDIAVQLGAVPSEMVKSTTTGSGSNQTTTNALVNPFGGSVTVEVGASGNKATKTDGSSFIITYAGIGRDICVSLATPDWGSGSSSGLVSISIADEEGTAITHKHGDTNGLPITLKAASEECKNLNNKITWEYQ